MIKVYNFWHSHWADGKGGDQPESGRKRQSRTVGGVGPNYSDRVRSRTDVASEGESPLASLTSPVAR